MHFTLLNIVILKPEFQLNFLKFFCLQWESNSGPFLNDDFLNDLLFIDWDLGSEDIACTYISLIKRFSLDLDPKSVRLLYNSELSDFPIYNTALKFWEHPDHLNRASCHAVLLNIFKVADDDLLEYLVNKKNATRYFVNILVKEMDK